MKNNFKEFKPTSWSIDNKTSIYVLAVILCIFGIINYNSIPKEQFPELTIPTYIVTSIYPGTSPTDMENLVTRPIEKNLKSISGVKKITSNSVQDFSSIVVEFNTGIELSEAKQRVKDAVDKTLPDLPNDLLKDPSVMEIDFSEIPIMYLNVSGDYDLNTLKKYAEDIQDRIESFKEITRVDIVGALDREILIDIDMYRMQAAGATFGDIERAVAYDNITVSGGSIDMYGMRRSIRVVGEFKDVETIRNITLGSSNGALIKLRDIADVKDSFKEQESYSRFNGKNVITLNIIKKSGQNLIDAADNIKEAIKKMEEKDLPKDLEVAVTGDVSHYTRGTLSDLNNTIIIGFILVTIILMFFMGLTNAIFVGLSVPLSMAICYIVMPWMGFTMNMLVMFSFIFCLGIVVDDAIVVIENTHRIFKKTKMDIVSSAKFAAGEVFMPILSGTLTTLAPFFPLAFWPGIVGKFMFFIPVTVIITLFASLIVAYIINPVFAVDFMTHDDKEIDSKPKSEIFKITSFIAGPGVLFHLMGWHGFGNFMFIMGVLYLFHNLYGYKMINYFQHHTLPSLLNKYENLLKWVLWGNRPYRLLVGVVLLFFASLFIFVASKPKIVFFPDNQPNSIDIYIETPVGTDVKVTDSVSKNIEAKVLTVLGKENKLIESVVTNVALGASSDMFSSGMKTSNLAKITINFVEFSKRKGVSTTIYLDSLRNNVKNIPGVAITVDKNRMGPPTGKAINIEVSSENMDELIATSYNLMRYIDSLKILGIEDLKSDFDQQKPELLIDIDRNRANHEGITSGQVGMEIRTAVLGKEISKFRDGEDQYPIQLRYNDYQRENIDRLMNMKISYRDMNTGIFRQIPLSSVAKIHYQNTYGGIKRKNLKRVITIGSNVLTGYTANEINMKLDKVVANFPKSSGVEINMTGEREDQAESSAFLGKASLLAILMVIFILITQFNSISKSIIILSEILFSLIGVFLGFAIFRMPFSIVMSGIGIVALCGIVVRNGILLVEFTDLLKEKGMRTRDAIIQAGKTRITPVLLTATATMLGLIPLALGFNIDFGSLLTELKPHIYFGGENLTFFGGLSWTIIFGLSFATVLTLIFIPIMYLITYSFKLKFRKHHIHKYNVKKYNVKKIY